MLILLSCLLLVSSAVAYVPNEIVTKQEENTSKKSPAKRFLMLIAGLASGTAGIALEKWHLNFVDRAFAQARIHREKANEFFGDWYKTQYPHVTFSKDYQYPEGLVMLHESAIPHNHSYHEEIESARQALSGVTGDLDGVPTILVSTSLICLAGYFLYTCFAQDDESVQKETNLT